MAWLAALAPIAVVACGDGDPTAGETRRLTQAITHGELDTTSDAVVVLVSDRKGGHCSGVLIAPRVVLTAAHCLDRGVDRVCFGSQLDDRSRCVDASGVEAHPAYASEAPDSPRDLAVVRLVEDAPATPLPIMTTPLEELDASTNTVRIVGFGLTRPFDHDPRSKRTGTARLEALEGDTFTVAAAPSLTCGGDSGGPALATIDGREVVLGVTRSGDDECARVSRFTRLDVDDFVRAALEPTPSPPQATGCQISTAFAPTSRSASLPMLVLFLAIVLRRTERHPGRASLATKGGRSVRLDGAADLGRRAEEDERPVEQELRVGAGQVSADRCRRHEPRNLGARPNREEPSARHALAAR